MEYLALQDHRDVLPFVLLDLDYTKYKRICELTLQRGKAVAAGTIQGFSCVRVFKPEFGQKLSGKKFVDFNESKYSTMQE